MMHRLLLSRSPGFTRQLLAKPKPYKPAYITGLGNHARLGKIQTRLAHVVPPPVPPPAPLESPSHEDIAWVAKFQAHVSHFSDLFRSSPPDLAEQLMSTITPKPGLNCALALSTSLCGAALHQVDALICSVVQALSKTKDLTIVNDSHFFLYEPNTTFWDMVTVATAYFIWGELHACHHSKEVPDDMPIDRVIRAALFSASAVKNGLLDVDFICAFTRYGLQLSGSGTLEDERKDFAAIATIGACLQLITAGGVFMEKHFSKTHSLADIIAALEALRMMSSIGPGGRALLEKTIEAAKANFANPLSPFDACKVLFLV